MTNTPSPLEEQTIIIILIFQLLLIIMITIITIITIPSPTEARIHCAPFPFSD